MTYAEILMRKGKRGAAAYVQVSLLSNSYLSYTKQRQTKIELIDYCQYPKLYIAKTIKG